MATVTGLAVGIGMMGVKVGLGSNEVAFADVVGDLAIIQGVNVGLGASEGAMGDASPLVVIGWHPETVMIKANTETAWITVRNWMASFISCLSLADLSV
jgi:hypothetical protein